MRPYARSSTNRVSHRATYRVDVDIAEFVIEPLVKAHKRVAFSCGNAQLDRYMRELARQRHAGGGTRVYIMRHVPTDNVAGFYTLSATSIETINLPQDLVKNLPRYPTQGAILIGQLARDLAFRGTDVGKWLLRDALERSVSIQREHLGAVAVVVDAVDDHAVRFYETFGFARFAAMPDKLYIPMATIATASSSTVTSVPAPAREG